MCGNIENVQTLLELKADPNHKVCEQGYCSPLHIACRLGNFEIVRKLVDAGANIDASDGKSRSPLHFACWCGHKEIVDYLIREAGCVVGELVC